MAIYDIIKKIKTASFKNMQKRTIVLGLVFVFLGFLCAFFVFNFLTTEKPAAVSASSMPTAKPAPISVKSSKGLQLSSTTKIDTTLKSNVQNPLPEKRQDTKGDDQEAIKGEVPTLILNGIFSSGSDSLALINNRIVREGDLISGVKVIRIYPNKVDLESDGQKITLRVK